ncbi:MAG: ABC transporter permease subunit, partial [Planctomycetes bacterium]|nr:ABC transporter permease subunit [Planctomycetota bacterium]
MASLPSVVLGFLGGIVIAPFVEDVVPAVLVSALTVPFVFLLGAYLWQLLPPRITLRADRFRPLLLAALLPVGILAAYAAGPAVERWLFAGNLRLWLDGQVGGPTGGWLVLFLPISALGTILAMTRWIGPRMRSAAMRLSRVQIAALDLGRFCAGCAVALIGALAAAYFVGGLGFDPRGSLVGTYIQRNALVVGFVMGFAVIPIIYTIAEDALSTVPEHLRSGSLAAGATPWQTATRIVVPTAMSGLFSAVMIGMGRAVGETMIVLMAAGNTPILDVNIFNGFRTLSANIAVELPEAVRNSTHYRTLFLAGLVLFAMTFVINTLAEVVRLR